MKKKQQTPPRNHVVLALLKRSHSGSGAHIKSKRKETRELEKLLSE